MFRRMLSDQRGQAIVELALIAPVLLMILFGVIEFGRMYNSYLTIDNATRSGARIGITGASDLDIKNTILSQTYSLPNSTSVVVSISPTYSSRVRGQDLAVKTDYSFKFIAPIIGNILGENLTLTSNVIMRLE